MTRGSTTTITTVTMTPPARMHFGKKPIHFFLTTGRDLISKEGTILALGTDGLQHILDAEIIPFDEKNVDSKVRNAIAKWRNRHLSLSDKKEAIRELAEVFEWLKKIQKLDSALDRKDELAIFEIANQFGICHHDPKQKTNYDPAIWYSWIFHFYLATYHAAIRLLKREDPRLAAIKAKVYKHSNFMGSCLDHLSGWHFEHGEAVFRFAQKDSFFADLLKNREQQTILRAVCAQVLGQPIDLCKTSLNFRTLLARELSINTKDCR
jgi:hypothetical protein